LFSFFKSQIWLNCRLQQHIIPQQQLWYKQSDNIRNSSQWTEIVAKVWPS
jgi:hypothetical protein